MVKSIKRPPLVMWLIIVLLILLGLGALAGGVALMSSPDGSIMNLPLSMLDHSPFSSFLIPGAILFSVLGVYPIVVAYCLWRKPGWHWPEAINPFRDKHWSWAASLSVGLILVIWISVQVLVIRSINYFHVVYFFWGWLLILLTLTLGMRRYYTR